MQSEKPSPSALPDAVIQFNPLCLSFNSNYALKPPRSCLLQSHNSWRAAVSSRRLMWWKRRQLQSHKTALISSLKLIMWRWKDAAPLCVLSVVLCEPLMCVTVLPEPSEMRSSACCFVLTCQQHLCFSEGSERLTPKVSSWVTNEFIFISRSMVVLRFAKIIYPFLRLGYINSSQFAVKIIISYYCIWHSLTFSSATVYASSPRDVFYLVILQTCRKSKSCKFVKSVWDKKIITA